MLTEEEHALLLAVFGYLRAQGAENHAWKIAELAQRLTKTANLLFCSGCKQNYDPGFNHFEHDGQNYCCKTCFDKTGRPRSNVDVASDARAAPKQTLSIEGQAYGYLKRVLEVAAPQLTPIPDLMGICTQVDSVIAHLRSQQLPVMVDREAFEKWLGQMFDRAAAKRMTDTLIASGTLAPVPTREQVERIVYARTSGTEVAGLPIVEDLMSLFGLREGR